MFHIFPIRFTSIARQPRTRRKCCVNVCGEVHRNLFHFHAISTAEATSGLDHFSSRLSPLVIAKKNGGSIFEEAKPQSNDCQSTLLAAVFFRCAFEVVCCRSFFFFFFFFHVPCPIRFWGNAGNAKLCGRSRMCAVPATNHGHVGALFLILRCPLAFCWLTPTADRPCLERVLRASGRSARRQGVTEMMTRAKG